jgi:hypothetical protein
MEWRPIVIDLKTTPIGDGRHLIELMIGGSVKAAVPCRAEDPADVARACDKIKGDVPTVPDDLASRIREACRPKGVEPVPIEELIRQFPKLRDPVIHGILRRGETCNIIAASKTGKSFLAGVLAWSVATGRHWLGHEVTKCRVLIVDNELHPETLANRLDRIAFAMQIENSERDGLDVINLRGLGLDVDGVGSELIIPENEYGLVIIDALYRWLPEGCSENDNAQMMRIYNQIDELAKRWGAAVVIIHHSSKGDQSEKALTDVGAGAGSIARAADTHLAIRPHEQPGFHVLEAVTRSFPSPEPVSIRFTYPTWHAETIKAQIKTRNQANGEAKQQERKKGKESVYEAIPMDGEVSQSAVRNKTGFRQEKVISLIAELVKEKKVKIDERPGSRKNEICCYYSRVSTGDSTVKNASQESVQA